MVKDKFDFKDTSEIDVPSLLRDQVIGQENAVEVIEKVAKQRRHLLLIGEPGTGKSLIGQALAELLPHEKLTDVICSPNVRDENNPLISEVPSGQGRRMLEQAKLKTFSPDGQNSWGFLLILLAIFFIGSTVLDWIITKETSDILKAADRIVGTMFIIVTFLGVLVFYSAMKMKFGRKAFSFPKLIVDNSQSRKAPFIDATGLHEGALLGDVQHDPFQSGGLGTPAHERVSVGAMHLANKGVLFIDEIATLKPEMQIELLTAMQEKKYPITGRSERSAGAMVKTQPVPTDFILVAAGNLETMNHMHPALRSRIRGGGYEVYMEDRMKDSPENVKRVARFVAQEVRKDGKIPHFTAEGVQEIINESRLRAGRRGYLTLKLRDLGGLIRAAGDLAKEENISLVNGDIVKRAKKKAATLEQQIATKYTAMRKDYQVIRVVGNEVGRVNGLAVIGDDTGSGIVLPIEASVVMTMTKGSGKIFATGKLGEIAKEAITNVSAFIKKYSSIPLSDYDIHIQFLQTFEGVEGDSASISVATAVLSSLENIPLRQDVAMTGSLSIRGEVLPIGGVNAKILAAKEAGVKTVIIPKGNAQDVLVDTKGIEIISVSSIAEVAEYALKWPKNSKKVLQKMKKSVL